MLTHTSTFRVRHYECDGYGHLNNANYLRYAQEAALGAWAARGFSLARLAAMDRAWQSRAIDIEYLRPLMYGEAVEVSVRLIGFDGPAARLAAEFTMPNPTSDVVARTTAEVVFVDNATGHPAAVPDELARALCGEYDRPGPLPPAEPFPLAPPPPPGLFTIEHRVAWHDLDATGQVNDAAYLVYTEDCGMDVIAAHGWPVTRMTAEGFAIVLRRQQIEFLERAHPEDELEVATWASNVRRVMATRHYTITRKSDGALLTRSHTLGVWVNLGSGRPIRIPDNFLADFAPNMVNGG